MKTLSNIIFLFIILILTACLNKQAKINDQLSINANVILTEKADSLSNLNTQVDIFDPAKLYSIVENRRDISLKRGSNPLTLKKIITKIINDYKNEMIIKYQGEKIITVINRIYDNENKVIEHKIFYFDPNNNCNWYTIKSKENKSSQEYIFFDDIIIQSNYKLKPIILEKNKRNQIIISAKSSLDSIMDHFPEFEYTFNWE